MRKRGILTVLDRFIQQALLQVLQPMNVYVRSRRAGDRVMGLLKRLYAKLRLRVNASKSAVDLATRRKLLGYSFG